MTHRPNGEIALDIRDSVADWTPYLPPSCLLAGLLGVATLVGLGTVLPAALLTRRPAIEAAELDP